jgi:pyruvate,water dikinase
MAREGGTPSRTILIAMIERYTLGLEELDRTQVALVGGKGALLGELSRIDGVRVPAGFCVTTDAFRRIMAEAPEADNQLDRLSRLGADDRDAIQTLSEQIRRTIEETAIPDEVAEPITRAIVRLGAQVACAVRSSATAEDLPTASFAGQQDTYLNVVGATAILRHISRCWASLFTERAVAYRVRNGFEHRTTQIAVVVQEMVFPQTAGVLFTADPVTSDRKVTSIEASFGLGEALVSGLVTPDVYKVRDGQVVTRAIGKKQLASYASPAGGTQQLDVEPERQEQPALTDMQIVRLAQLGRRIEAHFGQPQDIEWCLASDGFRVVQSRPITTLFPIPDSGDDEHHVYVSVGHQQMMTDPMKPLGLSLWQLTTRRPMFEAGGRLFVDVIRELGSPSTRAALLRALGGSDPLIGDALQTVVDRGDFIPILPDETPRWTIGGDTAPLIEADEAIVTSLIAGMQASIAALHHDIHAQSGAALFDFIRTDLQELQRILFDPQSHQVLMAGMRATSWLNEHIEAWLGDKNAADALAQSAPNNVTSEMGLALLDVADAIRPYPDVVAYLQHVEAESFLDDLPALAGGRAASAAIHAYLDTYGMRCIGEIDVTRPRWSERPTTLVPMILGNIRNFGPGTGERRFEQGLEEAQTTEQEVLARVRALPDGQDKAAEVKRMIDRVRTFIGYREYPKYHMVSRYFVYKQAILAEAARLVDTAVLRTQEDIFYLRFSELRDVVLTNQVDEQLIHQRKEAFRSFLALTPPRVLTSDGEVIAGTYRRTDVPAGALVGLPVSAGTIEGRARVILDMADADLETGDILVTSYTDPSWTPAFVAVKGLVTEVGGLMTHGAVIAREYGLPAVVGVEQATHKIRDGQRIRVHGTDGYIEILP